MPVVVQAAEPLRYFVESEVCHSPSVVFGEGTSMVFRKKNRRQSQVEWETHNTYKMQVLAEKALESGFLEIEL